MLDILVALLILGVWLAFVGFSIYLWIGTVNNFDFAVLGLAILLTILSLMPVAFVYDEFKKDKAVQEVSIVEVEVIQKQYVPSRTTMVMSGKTMVPMHISAKYNITITDEDHTKRIDNYELYNSLELGDRFKVEKIIYIDKSNKVFDKDFRFTKGE